MKNMKKSRLIGIGTIIILVIALTTYFALRDNVKYEIKDNIVHELGWYSLSESDDDSAVVFNASDFITTETMDEFKVIVNYEDSDLVEHNDEVFLAVGTYQATVSKLDDTRAEEFEFEVKDTTSPILKNPDSIRLVFEDIDKTSEDLVSQIKSLFDDVSKFDVQISEDTLKEIKLDTPGTYSIQTVVEDEHLNKSETEVLVQLIVLEKEVVTVEDIEGKTFAEVDEIIKDKVVESEKKIAQAKLEQEKLENDKKNSNNPPNKAEASQKVPDKNSSNTPNKIEKPIAPPTVVDESQIGNSGMLFDTRQEADEFLDKVISDWDLGEEWGEKTNNPKGYVSGGMVIAVKMSDGNGRFSVDFY